MSAYDKEIYSLQECLFSAAGEADRDDFAKSSDSIIFCSAVFISFSERASLCTARRGGGREHIGRKRRLHTALGLASTGLVSTKRSAPSDIGPQPRMRGTQRRLLPMGRSAQCRATQNCRPQMHPCPVPGSTGRMVDPPTLRGCGSTGRLGWASRTLVNVARPRDGARTARRAPLPASRLP